MLLHPVLINTIYIVLHKLPSFHTVSMDTVEELLRFSGLVISVSLEESVILQKDGHLTKNTKVVIPIEFQIDA